MQNITVFYAPKDRLRLTIEGEKSFLTVKPVWASPISFPGKYLAFLDGKDQEIVTLEDTSLLDKESRLATEQELDKRYLTSAIVRIANAKVEFGATYWHVITHRGEKDFVTQSLQENAVWMTDNHLLLIDVDGNRFEIQDIAGLDARSRQILFSIV
jgi:hypothetical protein